MDAIATESLARKFGEVEALRGLTLNVKAGECVGLLGPNGAGKTTTIKLLLGLIRPTGGTAEVFGCAPGHPNVRRRVGYSPETPHFYPFLSARETLRFYGKLSGLKPAQVDADGILRQVGLSDAADKQVGGFSKGMAQRLAVAQALVGDPELLFLDEPSSGLDPLGRVEMRSLIRQLATTGRTILLNTHIIADVETVASRVIMLKAGQLAAVEDLTHTQALGVTAQVTDLKPAALDALRAWGLTVAYDGEQLTLAGLQDGQEPDVVARLVAGGGRIYSFTPRRVSLEQRFLEVMAVGGEHHDC